MIRASLLAPSLFVSALFATALMVYPVLRAFSMVQISYNEG